MGESGLWKINDCSHSYGGKIKDIVVPVKIGNIELTETSEKDLMKILLILVIKVTF